MTVAFSERSDLKFNPLMVFTYIALVVAQLGAAADGVAVGVEGGRVVGVGASGVATGSWGAGWGIGAEAVGDLIAADASTPVTSKTTAAVASFSTSSFRFPTILSKLRCHAGRFRLLTIGFTLSLRAYACKAGARYNVGMPKLRAVDPYRQLLLLILALLPTALFLALVPRNPTAPSLILADCRQATDKQQCYERYFSAVTQNRGATTALDELEETNQTDAFAKASCHELVHEIGRSALRKYGTVAESAKYADELCWSGYFHGVMQAYMSGFDDSTLSAEMPRICDDQAKKRYNFDHYNCVHGLGHGLTIRFDQDVFKSLEYCQILSDSWERASCYGGVFMQNVVADGKYHKAVALKTDDLIYPCNAIKEDQKEQCFLMQTSYILKQLQQDYRKAFEICEGVEAPYVSTCYRSMGRDISGNSLRDPNQVAKLCSLGRLDLQKDCIDGAVRNAVFEEHGRVNADKLCKLLQGELLNACVRGRDEALRTL